MSAVKGGYIHDLAEVLGASEPALRLIFSVLFGYPLAFIYRSWIHDKSKMINHLFILLTGVSVIVFNYGYDVYHSFIAICTTYLLINILKGSALVIVAFVFNMAYLLLGYYFTGTETYDIKWTMPHCVLTLRLIGLAFDVSDGQRPDEKLSAENKKSCLRRIPNIIEILAYTLFPASLLVGPQFSFRRYESFINKEFNKYTDNYKHGLCRGGIGLIYLAVYQIGSSMLPDNYFLSLEYANRNIFVKWILMGFWGKIVLYKYISCWLLSEGAATCFGLTFVEMKDGKEDWTGCENIKLMVFENAYKFQNYVTAFNVNTNHWLAEYVYKRLKFLGNRSLSHGAALLFLAIWHGFHSGYYMCFLMEFIIIHSEKQVLTVLQKNETFVNFTRNPIVSIFVYILLKFYTLVGMGYSLVPFVFLTFSKWWYIYQTVYFYGFIVFLPGPIYAAILKQILPSTQTKKD